MDLKAISCRIEWSLFQVHSTKSTCYSFYNKFDHKAIIVAFRCQRVKPPVFSCLTATVQATSRVVLCNFSVVIAIAFETYLEL